MEAAFEDLAHPAHKSFALKCVADCAWEAAVDCALGESELGSAEGFLDVLAGLPFDPHEHIHPGEFAADYGLFHEFGEVLARDLIEAFPANAIATLSRRASDRTASVQYAVRWGLAGVLESGEHDISNPQAIELIEAFIGDHPDVWNGPSGPTVLELVKQRFELSPRIAMAVLLEAAVLVRRWADDFAAGNA